MSPIIDISIINIPYNRHTALIEIPYKRLTHILDNFLILRGLSLSSSGNLKLVKIKLTGILNRKRFKLNIMIIRVCPGFHN